MHPVNKNGNGFLGVLKKNSPIFLGKEQNLEYKEDKTACQSSYWVPFLTIPYIKQLKKQTNFIWRGWHLIVQDLINL